MNTKEIKDRLDANTAIDSDEIRELCDDNEYLRDELERSERTIQELLRNIRLLASKVAEA